MLVLPKEKSVPKVGNPKFLILMGRPKSGKSSLMAELKSNLVIDLEDGYEALSAMIVKAKSVNDLAEIANALKEEIKNNNNEFPYKRITIDNATRLEELCLPYAAQLYKMLPQAKNWTGTDVRTLPQGSGYGHLRTAVRKVIDMFRGLCETLILVTHTKDKFMNHEGNEISEIAVNLTGQLGDILCGEADAVGYVYRKANETIVSFKGGDNTIKEARQLHLKGKEIVVAESDADNNITFHMDRIFLEQ